MKKYLYICAVLLLACPIMLAAQSNYKPGYVVTLKGDTLNGFIDYKEWNNNPSTINFKKNTNTVAQTYAPQNINGFGVTGFDIYQTYKGNISQNRTELSRLTRTIDSTYITDTVFLRIVAKGKNVTLLNYVDGIKGRYFIAEKSEQPVELIYRAYISNNNGNGIAEDFDTKYKKQLHVLRTIYLPGNSRLINAIQTAQYTEKDLLKIVDELNETTSSTSASRGKVRFFVGVGVSRSTSHFYGFASSPTYIAPMATAGIDVILNKNTGKFIFRTELNLTANQVRSTEDNDHSRGLNFDQKTISFTPQFLYHFYSTPNFKLYLGLGTAINYAIYSNKQYYSTTTFRRYYYDFPTALTPVMYFDFVSKVGVVLSKKFDIHINYIPTYTTAVTRISTLQAGVNYLFK